MGHMTITTPLGRDDCEGLCVNCTNCSNRESIVAGDCWQSNAFLFQAAAVTHTWPIVHLLLNWVFNNF